MAPSLALHIGAHKTASTYLQDALRKARPLLDDAGVRLLTPYDLRQPGEYLRDRFAPRPGMEGPDLLRHQAGAARRLVITEENLPGRLHDLGLVRMPVYPNAATHIGALADAIAPCRVELFVCLRRPTGFLASAYSQVLLARSVIAPEDFFAANDWRRLDWVGYLQRLAAIPGVGRINVWRYEDHIHVIRPVLRRLLGWKLGAQVPLPPRRSHQGMSQTALRATLEWVVEGRSGDLAAEARRRYPVNRHNPALRLYDPDTEEAADAAYADQMARIAALDRVEVLRPSRRVAQA